MLQLPYHQVVVKFFLVFVLINITHKTFRFYSFFKKDYVNKCKSYSIIIFISVVLFKCVLILNTTNFCSETLKNTVRIYRLSN